MQGLEKGNEGLTESSNLNIKLPTDQKTSLYRSKIDLRHVKFFRLAVLVLQQELACGHLKWKATVLSRLSFVSRSRIYEMFGSTKKQIVLSALKLVLDEIYGTFLESRDLNDKNVLLNLLVRSRKAATSSPEILEFYFFNRHKPNAMGALIRNYEERSVIFFNDRIKSKSREDALFARSVIQGIIVSPFLTEQDAEKCFSKLLNEIL